MDPECYWRIPRGSGNGRTDWNTAHLVKSTNSEETPSGSECTELHTYCGDFHCGYTMGEMNVFQESIKQAKSKNIPICKNCLEIKAEANTKNS